MNYTDIIKDIENKKYSPIYFLMGDEPYYIDIISNYIANNVLTEAEKGFNQHILYGDTTDADAIITAARRFPMMANKQVVIVKEAQHIKKIEDTLLPYAQQPMESTILVICYKYKTIDGRKAFAKQIKKTGLVFESKQKRQYEMIDWIAKFLEGEGYKIGAKASALLAEYLGTDLGRISSEFQKLTVSLPKGSEITTEVIEEKIGISKDYNIFELIDALGTRDVLKCNKIINYYAANIRENPIQRTIISVYGFFNRLLQMHLCKATAQSLGIHPFLFNKDYVPAAKAYSPKKIVENIAILREFDMKSKGSGNVSSSPADLQKEMIYKLLH